MICQNLQEINKLITLVWLHAGSLQLTEVIVCRLNTKYPPLKIKIYYLHSNFHLIFSLYKELTRLYIQGMVFYL